MADEIIERKVYDYLYRHFPIQRLKDDATKRFRRGIMLYDSLSTEKMFFQPKARTLRYFRLLCESANISKASAIGATHHRDIGSKAALRSSPLKADKSRFTNLVH